MDIESMNRTFATNYTRSDDDLPREERVRVRVFRYFSHVGGLAAAMSEAESEKAQHLIFIMKRLYEKLPDADEDILSRFALPLVPTLDDWLKKLRIPLVDIGVRIKIDRQNFITAALCNHGGPNGCDCGEHEKDE